MKKQKHSIVVIDDEESMRDSCRMILEKDGFLTETAENGNSGLAKVEKIRPDLVLIDLKMPGISGLEVLEKSKRSTQISFQLLLPDMPP